MGKSCRISQTELLQFTFAQYNHQHAGYKTLTSTWMSESEKGGKHEWMKESEK